MRYISSAEAAKKWGISSRRVMVLAKQGRLEGAVLIGSRWMIPETSPKPVDGRSHKVKQESEYDEAFFRYPAFEGCDVSSFEPPLSGNEVILKKTAEAFHECRFKEAEKILMPMIGHVKNRYNRIQAFYYACMIYFMLGKTTEFLEYYGRLEMELQEDFPHRREMELLIHEVDASIGMSGFFANDFTIESDYEYHETYMSHLAMLCLVSLNYSDFDRLKAQDLTPYEYIAASLDGSCSYVDIQTIHFYLGLAYSNLLDTEKMTYHYRKALELSEKHHLYYQAALMHFYYGKTINHVLNEFDADFQNRVRRMGHNIHSRFTQFIESAAIRSIYGLLSSQDFLYVFYAVNGLNNKQVADILHVSESTVGKRYSEIYASLKVKNKKGMKDLYHSLTSPSHI